MGAIRKTCLAPVIAVFALICATAHVHAESLVNHFISDDTTALRPFGENLFEQEISAPTCQDAASEPLTPEQTANLGLAAIILFFPPQIPVTFAAPPPAPVALTDPKPIVPVIISVPPGQGGTVTPEAPEPATLISGALGVLLSGTFAAFSKRQKAKAAPVA